MRNEHADAEVAAALDAFKQQMELITRIQQQRTLLTATASVRRGRVTVTVNADGTVIETKFSDSIDDLNYGEIAAAITAAAQQAAAEITRKTKELMTPLEDSRRRLPDLSEFVEGMPDMSELVSAPPQVPITPPGAPERLAAAVELDGTMRFTDVEDFNHDEAAVSRSNITDSGW